MGKSAIRGGGPQTPEGKCHEKFPFYFGVPSLLLGKYYLFSQLKRQGNQTPKVGVSGEVLISVFQKIKQEKNNFNFINTWIEEKLYNDKSSSASPIYYGKKLAFKFIFL